MEKYDSSTDTLVHIKRVNELLIGVVGILLHRGNVHDASKLESPEKEIFDEVTPKLRNLTYGSDAYKKTLLEMKPALEHHYRNNSHHVEHYSAGVDGMSLFDLIEMLCDWKAAGERHSDGSMKRSLEINQTRFHISPQLQAILDNTAKELGWI